MPRPRITSLTPEFSRSFTCSRNTVDLPSGGSWRNSFSVAIQGSASSEFQGLPNGTVGCNPGPSGQDSKARWIFERSTHLKDGRKGYMAEDQQLMCSDCGQSFTFTAEDQEFFRDRGYSAPKRCKPCRQAKKNEQSGGGGGYQRSESRGTSVICSGCGQQTTVPFEPRGDRPVYCQTCFQSRKTSTGGGGRRNFGRGR
jgi:CxxC-x17-CxxC domain-containing protein